MAVFSTRAKLYAVRKNVFIALLKHGYFDNVIWVHCGKFRNYRLVKRKRKSLTCPSSKNNLCYW